MNEPKLINEYDHLCHLEIVPRLPHLMPNNNTPESDVISKIGVLIINI